MLAGRLAVQFYRLTLLCYPAAHRRDWGEVMQATFEAMCQDALQDSGVPGLMQLCLRTLVDTFASALREHFETMKGQAMSTPTQIDDYQIQTTLGDGGAAVVYHVRDAQGRDAALKLFNEDDRPGFYQREVENLRRIDHPAAPKLLQAEGQYGKQRYCVLEYIEGHDWLSLRESQPDRTTTQEVLKWAIQICEFLDFLHNREQPLYFRGIKPANLMVQPDGRVRLVDFDLMEAKVEDPQYPKVGTEGYSPPEQYVGRSDARSDIYSLGASLYHVLTGRDPRSSTPFMFHFHPPCSLNPALSPELEAVILKAVEHKPVDRFVSAADMKAALQACLEAA